MVEERVATSLTEDEQRRAITALVEYSRSAYEAEHKRFEWLELKAGRYLTVLAVILGTGSFALPALVEAANQPATLSRGLFLSGYALTAISALMSMLASVETARIEDVPGPPVGDEVVRAFIGSEPVALLRGFAERLNAATKELRRINDRRALMANRAHLLLRATIWLGTATAVLYVVIRTRG